MLYCLIAVCIDHIKSEPEDDALYFKSECDTVIEEEDISDTTDETVTRSVSPAPPTKDTSPDTASANNGNDSPRPSSVTSQTQVAAPHSSHKRETAHHVQMSCELDVQLLNAKLKNEKMVQSYNDLKMKFLLAEEARKREKHAKEVMLLEAQIAYWKNKK